MPTTTNPSKPTFEPETRTRKGVEEARCRWCGEFKPVTREFWLAHRDGIALTRIRCKTCSKSYRDALREQARSGKREVKTREARVEPLDPEVVKAVYTHVLEHSAASRGEIAKATSLDPKLIDKALAAMDGQLVTSEKINGRRAWQTYYTEDDPNGRRKGQAALRKWLKGREPKSEAEELKV